MMFFFLFSCASSPYLKNYEPIRLFLINEKIDPLKSYVLQMEKVDNKEVLFDFKEYKKSGPYFDSNFKPIAYHNEKEYKKMVDIYINDTLKRYWRKSDFSDFNFILKKRQSNDSINYYLSNQNRIYISEPMYFWKKRYIIFSYDIYNNNGGVTKLVFMKKRKSKWEIDKILSTDVFF